MLARISVCPHLPRHFSEFYIPSNFLFSPCFLSSLFLRKCVVSSSRSVDSGEFGLADLFLQMGLLTALRTGDSEVILNLVSACQRAPGPPDWLFPKKCPICIYFILIPSSLYIPMYSHLLSSFLHYSSFPTYILSPLA